MNVSKINLNFLNFNQTNDRKINNNNYYFSKFGLKMASPLHKDTVSFGLQAKSSKKSVKKVVETISQEVENFRETEIKRKVSGGYKDAMTQGQAIMAKESCKTPHKVVLRAFKRTFGSLISEQEGQAPITIYHRIKSIDSIRVKSSKEADIQDVSGFCFVMENKNSFKSFVDGFEKFINATGCVVTNYDYKVIAPEVHKISRKETLLKTFEPFDPKPVEVLRKMVEKTGYKIGENEGVTPSVFGYSAIHITIRDKNGVNHEIQLMTKSMHKAKKVENLFYKAKQGKELPKPYGLIDLSQLHPDKIKSEVADQLGAYTLDVYKEAVEHPYSDIAMPRPNKYSSIKDFDFNKIFHLMKVCEGKS